MVSPLTARTLLQPRVIKSDRSRILWPLTLETYLKPESCPDAQSGYPCGLTLLHGHAILFAWWTLVYQALMDDRVSDLLRLWESALTATILVRVLASEGEIAAATFQTINIFESLRDESPTEGKGRRGKKKRPT